MNFESWWDFINVRWNNSSQNKHILCDLGLDKVNNTIVPQNWLKKFYQTLWLGNCRNIHDKIRPWFHWNRVRITKHIHFNRLRRLDLKKKLVSSILRIRYHIGDLVFFILTLLAVLQEMQILKKLIDLVEVSLNSFGGDWIGSILYKAIEYLAIFAAIKSTFICHL